MKKSKQQTKNKKSTLKTLRRLLSYLLREKKLLIIAYILIIVSTVCYVIGSYMLRPIINDAIIPGEIRLLTRQLLILGGLYLCGALSVWIQYRILNKAGQRTVYRIRNELFQKMETLPLRYFDQHRHGELMSRYTNDMDRISEVLTETLSDMLTNILTLLSIFGMMLYISPILTVTTIVIVPIMLLMAKAVIKKSKRYFQGQQAVLGETNGYIEEMISGQKVVKVFRYEERAEEEFEIYNENLRKKAEKAQLFSGMMMPLMQNMNTLNFVFVSIVGGLLAITQGFDLGGLAAFLQYSRQFGRPINELSSQYNTLQAAIAGAERVFQLMDTPSEENHIPSGNLVRTIPKGDIRFKNVDFAYNPGTPVLKQVNFHAIPGKKIALVGSTGAGKTTIFNILPRFYDIQGGEILLDGIELSRYDRDVLRKSIALVLQDTHLFSGSVMENIRYGRLDATDDEVIEASKLVAAHSFIESLPHGYATLLQDDGGNLSQGQRQLLSIARAAVADPPILLLDEATSDIDSRTEKMIQEGMDKLMQGRSSLVIAHRLSTVQNADEILIIENGRIIERGSHRELLLKKGRYHQLSYNTTTDTK